MQPAVKIYSTPTCVFCRMAKDFFKEHGVKFTEVDVAADEAAAQEMIDKTGQMVVPVIEVGEKVIIGFDKPRLKQLLGIA